jgi:hypothetical protein
MAPLTDVLLLMACAALNFNTTTAHTRGTPLFVFCQLLAAMVLPACPPHLRLSSMYDSLTLAE